MSVGATFWEDFKKGTFYYVLVALASLIGSAAVPLNEIHPGYFSQSTILTIVGVPCGMFSIPGLLVGVIVGMLVSGNVHDASMPVIGVVGALANIAIYSALVWQIRRRYAAYRSRRLNR